MEEVCTSSNKEWYFPDHGKWTMTKRYEWLIQGIELGHRKEGLQKEEIASTALKVSAPR